MRLLLDTHAFLWFVGGDSRLSQHARERIESPENEVFLSVASIWEIAIKVRAGKLLLPTPFEAFLLNELINQSIGILPIEATHALAVASLPDHHRDPFDRLLVAQSLRETLPLISIDDKLDAYGIQREW
jgi:PIN domain nuclease of toxin-antitoxin system